MSGIMNNDFLEKEVTFSIRVPKDFDAATELRINEAFSKTLSDLGCELVESMEYRDITAPSVRHIDFETLKFRDFDDTGIPLQFFFGCEAPVEMIQKIAASWGYRGDLCTDISVCLDLYTPDERPAEAVLTFTDGEQRWVDLRSNKDQVDRLIDIACQAGSDRAKEAVRAYHELFESSETLVSAEVHVAKMDQSDTFTVRDLSAVGASLTFVCKVTFSSGGHLGQGNQFDVYIPVPKEYSADGADACLSADDRIQAYDKAAAIVGEGAISHYMIRTAEVVDCIWLLAYKDTLGHPDDHDNLTDICVPVEWFIQNLTLDGRSLADWFNEYTADDTEDLVIKAVSDGVILDCSSKDIDISCLNKDKAKDTEKPSLDSLIQSSSSKRKPSLHKSFVQEKDEKPCR